MLMVYSVLVNHGLWPERCRCMSPAVRSGSRKGDDELRGHWKLEVRVRSWGTVHLQPPHNLTYADGAMI